MLHSAQEARFLDFHFAKCTLMDLLSFGNSNPQGIEEPAYQDKTDS